jgi:SAM-dependent methyltransferase
VAATARNLEATRALLDALQHFQSHVVWYAQSVSAHAGAGRGPESSPEGQAILQASLDALTSAWLKEHDALEAREARFDAYRATMSRTCEELREAIAIAQQSTLAVRRAIETGATSVPPRTSGPAGLTDPVDLSASACVAFEDRFRGSTGEIRARLADYVPFFAGASDVIDIGCGRGELLDLFREAGIGARGIDVNDEMVAACRSRGLVAERTDAVAFLEAQPTSSLGGIVAVQVVEHLEPAYLARVLELAHTRLRPGAPLILETVNAACWAAFFDSYIPDLTHVRPLHPDALRHLVQTSGFSAVDVQYRAPVDLHDKLPTVRLAPPVPGAHRDAAVLDLVDALNAHAERLNGQLFTHRDYAVIARR